MKKSFVLMLAGLLVVALSGIAGAHIGTKIWPMYELATADLPDLRDGTLQDWEDVLPGSSLSQDDFTATTVGEGAPINPADLAWQVYFAWSSSQSKLYLAVKRVDDVYINTYAGGDLVNIWQFDGIEFMLDGDHSGGPYNGFPADQYTEEEIKLLSNYQAQQYVCIPESPDGRSLGYQGNGQGWVPVPPYADAGGFSFGASPSTAVIEMAVTPWDELNWQGPQLSKRTPLKANNIMGFQISVMDFDKGCASCDPGGYHGFYNIGGVENSWRLAEMFVDGELIPCTGGDCGAAAATAVQSDSWARIKASFK